MVEKFFIKLLYRFFEKNTNTDLPFSIKIDSGKTGKNIVIFGAIHGNEKVGVRLARLLITRFKRSQFKLKNGTITFILGNPKAFKKGVRYIDTDLNRSFFTKNKITTYEHTRSEEIIEYFKKNHINGVIDLHSVSVGDFKILLARNNDAEATDLIKKIAFIDTVLLFDEKYLPGTTMQLAQNLDSFALAVECGNHNNNTAIHTAEKAVYTLLSEIDMISLPEKFRKIRLATKLTILKTVGYIRAGSKFVYAMKNPQTGTSVQKGELIATTKEHGAQYATQDCELFVPTKQSMIKPTDHDAGLLTVKIDDFTN